MSLGPTVVDYDDITTPLETALRLMVAKSPVDPKLPVGKRRLGSVALFGGDCTFFCLWKSA